MLLSFEVNFVDIYIYEILQNQNLDSTPGILVLSSLFQMWLQNILILIF